MKLIKRVQKRALSEYLCLDVKEDDDTNIYCGILW